MSDEVRFLRGTKTVINSYSVSNGNIYLSTDTHEFFIDYNGERLQISNVIFLDTESDRSNILAPIPFKFYYVIESNKLYMYLASDWVLINSGYISVINSLESESTTDALSAAMGKSLNEQIGNINTVLSSLFTVSE